MDDARNTLRLGPQRAVVSIIYIVKHISIQNSAYFLTSRRCCDPQAPEHQKGHGRKPHTSTCSTAIQRRSVLLAKLSDLLHNQMSTFGADLLSCVADCMRLAVESNSGDNFSETSHVEATARDRAHF